MNTWRGIVKSLPVVKEGTRKWVKIGDSTNFWDEKWIEPRPLRDLLDHDEKNNVRNIRVADMWVPGRGWRCDEMPKSLPENVKRKLELVILSDNTDDSNEPYWDPEGSCKFSVKTTYCIANGVASSTQDHDWNKIWKLKVSERAKAFLWLVKHE